jgi:hypothetical protein
VTEKLTPWRVTASADCSQGESTSELNHPINLSHAESRAVTPISPAAQKFHRLILCSFLDNSFIFCKSSVPGLLFGKWHIADANQNIADPHAAAIATLSMNDRIIAPSHYYYLSIIISPSLVGNLYRQSDDRMVRCGLGTNGTSQDLRSMAEIRAKAVRCSTLS